MLGHFFTPSIISVLLTAEVSGFSFRVRPAWRVAALDVSFRPHCARFVFSYLLHPSAREDPEPHWQNCVLDAVEVGARMGGEVWVSFNYTTLCTLLCMIQ